MKIVSDLPLQGSDRVQTTQMNEAIKFVLAQNNDKAGAYNVEFEAFDDATAAAGKWDEAKCAENARTYVDTEDLVGVIGTYNSGCAAIIIPILNDASIAMVSPANTYAGLTHSAPGTESGEPDKYFPNGKRNYVRVVASDDNQGKVAAKYMKEKLGVTKVFILDDKELYGKGVADAFEGFAPDNGLTVVGHEGWNPQDPNYKALMTKIKATGADGIYIGGVSTNNGGQLIKDKVAGVGDNEAVKVMVSDGFVLSSLFDEAGADNVDGAIGTAPTQPPSNLSGAGAEFVSDIQAKLGIDDLEVYTVYAAACAQVLVDAITASDGTARACSTSCSRSSPTRWSGPCPSTRTATRPARSSRCISPRAASGPGRRPSRSRSAGIRGRAGIACPPRILTSWRQSTQQLSFGPGGSLRSPTCCCGCSARSCCSPSAGSCSRT